MTKLAANLSMLFTEYDFLDRFKAASDAGFYGVECQFPYTHRVDDIAKKLSSEKLELILHNLPAGNWEAGERGIACHPDRVKEFKLGVDLALRYAEALNVKQLNCLAGIVPHGVSQLSAHHTLLDNLRYAAETLSVAGVQLLIEPINTFDIPGFFLSTSKQAIDIIREVGFGDIFLQYDIYHMQRMEGELIQTIKNNLDVIKHIQVADNPGRFEPGTGEINFKNLFSQLDEMSYEGWIGCEYKPKSTTLAGLTWRAEHHVR